jgi:hypothetical protein
MSSNSSLMTACFDENGRLWFEYGPSANEVQFVDDRRYESSRSNLQLIPGDVPHLVHYDLANPWSILCLKNYLSKALPELGKLSEEKLSKTLLPGMIDALKKANLYSHDQSGVFTLNGILALCGEDGFFEIYSDGEVEKRSFGYLSFDLDTFAADHFLNGYTIPELKNLLEKCWRYPAEGKLCQLPVIQGYLDEKTWHCRGFWNDVFPISGEEFLWH